MATQGFSREAEGTQKPSFVFIPVFLSMLHNIDNRERLENVRPTYCCVCRVRAFTDLGGQIELALTDHSAGLKGKIYKNQHGNAVHAIQDYVFSQDAYASVIGTASNIDGEECLVVNRIKNVTAYREVDLHRSQVIWALLVKNSVIKVPGKNTQKVEMEIDTGSGGYESLPMDQQQIMRVIKGCNGGKNVSRDIILTKVRLMPSAIEKLLKILVENGILEEIDDFKAFSIV